MKTGLEGVRADRFMNGCDCADIRALFYECGSDIGMLCLYVCGLNFVMVVEKGQSHSG